MKLLLRQEHGALSVEAALVFSIMLAGCLAIGVVVLNGSEAASAADAAAQAGARAATKAQTVGGAMTAANSAVSSSTDSSAATCRVDAIDVGSMAPGEAVTVSVSCDSGKAGFAGFANGGQRYSAQATEIVDRYRTGKGT